MTTARHEEGAWDSASPYTSVFIDGHTYISTQATYNHKQAICVRLGNGVTAYLTTEAADRLLRLLTLAIADRVELEAEQPEQVTA